MLRGLLLIFRAEPLPFASAFVLRVFVMAAAVILVHALVGEFMAVFPKATDKFVLILHTGTEFLHIVGAEESRATLQHSMTRIR